MKTYLVKYNDYGRACVVANSYTECEEVFMKSGKGGESVEIKEIELICSETILSEIKKI